MKVVTIVFLILLSPILAMEKKSLIQSQPTLEEQSLIQLNYERNQEWEIKLKDLQQEVKVTLKGKEDIIGSVREDIREKKLKHPLPIGFLEELDALLKLLSHPEDLLSIEQRRSLMGFPLLENFQPIEKALHLLGVFIKKWGFLAAHAELLQLYANQTLWYHDEWTTFKDEIINKLSCKTLLCEDLLKIYDKVSFFYMRQNELAKSYAELPKIFNYMECMQYKLACLFQEKGATLWEIMRYSSLVKEFAKTNTLPKSYNELSTEFFQHTANPLKKHLSDDSHTGLITVSMPDQEDPSSSKMRPTRSVPMYQQSHSPLIAPRTKLLKETTRAYSAPTSRIGSPVSGRTKIETPTATPEASFIRRLQESFSQPENWDEEVCSVRKDTLSLIHANSIIQPLNKLVAYYTAFIKSYISNQKDSYDILSPKASLSIPGYPLIRIPQTLARRVCSLKSHGQLCFNLPHCDEETTLAFSSFVENLIFKKRRELYPSENKDQFLQFALENLFDIPSNPILLCACDDVQFYAPKDARQKLYANAYFEAYMRNQDAWNLKKNLDFITIHKKPKEGELFSDLLNKISGGQGTFQQLHAKAVGRQILFSFLTQACMSAHNFELIKDGNKFNLKRVGADPFLSPSFKLRYDGQHQLVGYNISYLLPIMNEEVPDNVKTDFTSNNIFLILSVFLTELTKLQQDFDDLILMHNLTEADELQNELSDALGETKLSKANVLGLSLCARRESIQELIQNFTIISRQLSLPGVTYNQIFQSLRPLEFDCYQQILESAQRKTQETPIFFTQVAPSFIQQLRKFSVDAECLGEGPPYSTEDLNAFEHASNLYHKTVNEYLKIIEKLGDKRYLITIEKDQGQLQLDEIQDQLKEVLYLNKIALEERVKIVAAAIQDKKREIDILNENSQMNEQAILQHQKELSNLVEALEKNKSEILELHKQITTISVTPTKVRDYWLLTQMRPSEQFMPKDVIPLCMSFDFNSIERDLKEKTKDLEKKENLEKKEDLEEKKESLEKNLADISNELHKIDQSLKELNNKLLFENIIQEFEGTVSPKTKSFLKKKYRWAKENHIFYANVVLNAWASMFDTEKPVIYETFVKYDSHSPDWASVPMYTQNQISTLLYVHMVESNHPIEKMVQDLIIQADISDLPHNITLEILDRLLTLNPKPSRYHKSWLKMVEIARNQFLAAPSHILNFLYSIGLKPEDKQRALQQGQLGQSGEYPRRIKDVTCKLSEVNPRPEQLASHLLRQLWTGTLNLDSEADQIFFDAILDLLLLPPSSEGTPCLNILNDPGSIGNTACIVAKPSTKEEFYDYRGGIFDLRYKVGDHYPLTQSAKWISLFNSPHILLLPAKIRLALCSHALPLLHLQWLASLGIHCPDTTFHPWYIQTLINKSSLLQKFLLTRLSFTFKDIISELWPELAFVIHQKLTAHNNDIDFALKSAAASTGQLNPVENNAVNLVDVNGQNILRILHEWEQVHMACIRTHPHNLHHAATQWMAHLNPADYEAAILTSMLELATQFTIDPTNITGTLWNNPKILNDLVNVRAPLECLKLVVSFRTRIPFQDISLPEKLPCIHYRISGLKGHVEMICELIRLFPNVTSLSLDHNELKSLRSLVPSLQTLFSLTELNLSNNPIHNPAPLDEFPQLTSLDIQNTGIPDVHLEALRELIACEKKVKLETIKLPKTMNSYFSGPSGTTETEAYSFIRKLDQHPSTLLELIRKYLMLPESLENTDKIICILEWLAEGGNNWLDTLVLEKKKRDLPCDLLFPHLKEFDPREAAYKLLFAIKYNLPHGSNPDTLSFVGDAPSMQANCLHRLEIFNVCVNTEFLENLYQFTNLYHFSLNKIKIVGQACVLKALPKLSQLRILKLENNGIKTLSGLHTEERSIKFPELNVLILTNNGIVSDRGVNLLPELRKLTYLYLQDNLLTELPPLGNIECFQHPELYNIRLDLSNNKIPANCLKFCIDTENLKFRPQKDLK
ncbi:MAG: hypothetical protein ACOH2E_05350 [Candidatus Paracaedibacter sp.]